VENEVKIVKSEGEVSAVLHSRDGQPYTAVTIYDRSGCTEVGVHRSRGGKGTGIDNCGLLGGPCNFEVAGAALPEDEEARIEFLREKFHQIHPTMVRNEP
jgi:hypothetical protein